MKRCPCCQRPMPEIRYGVVLSPLKARIFDYVLRHRGQSSYEIASAIFGNPDAALNFRVHVCQINSLFAHTNVRIRGDSKYGYEIAGLKSARAA